MTGLKLEQVLARFTHFNGSPLDHDIQVLMKYEGDVPGMMWVSQIAAGTECDIRIRVYGDKGALEWRHTNPMELIYSPASQPVRTIPINKDYNDPSAVSLCRLPAGHPEGFYEAFGNIYKSYCTHINEKREGKSERSMWYPTINEGLAAMYFVEACYDSDQAGGIWVDVKHVE